MRHAPQHIRALALGIIQQDDRLFVVEVHDEIKNSLCYRALGGGVDFGETSLDALKREFKEELDAELTDIHYLGCVENLFVYNGKPGHEIIFFYRCRFVDPKFYEVDAIAFMEGEDQHLAHWIPCDRFRSGELVLVPPACLSYLATPV